MFDISKWIKDDLLSDHTVIPVKISTKVKDFSEKYDIHIDVQILAVKKES